MEVEEKDWGELNLELSAYGYYVKLWNYIDHLGRDHNIAEFEVTWAH